MEPLAKMLEHYRYGPSDEATRERLRALLLPDAERLAEDLFGYMASDPYTLSFFPTEEAVRRRKAISQSWFQALLTEPLDEDYLKRLHRAGRIHVDIGLPGHYVNAAMAFVRGYCHDRIVAAADPGDVRALTATMDKLLDLNLDAMTEAYREEELRRVFLSRRTETALIRWAERLTQGMNLLLVVGLVAMSGAIAALFVWDVIRVPTGPLDVGVVRAVGSLLILWMMIELLHAEVRYLRGGRFTLRVFLELALVAFIRKLFVAALEESDPVEFGLVLASLLVLGGLFFLIVRTDRE